MEDLREEDEIITSKADRIMSVWDARMRRKEATISYNAFIQPSSAGIAASNHLHSRLIEMAEEEHDHHH